MTSSIVRICLITCLMIFISLTPAHAVEINDAGAKRLKSMLTQQIELRKTAFKQLGGDLITDGDISIEQGDGYYAATLPATTYKTATGENVKIGLVAINAIPTDNPDDWKMSVAIPTPILITDKEDKITKRINIGEQKMGGLWSSKLDSFSKLSAQYSDLQFTDIEKNEGFTIAKVAIKSDLEENKKGLWSGPTNLSISNFSGSSATIKELFSIKEIIAVADIEGYTPHDKEKMLKKIKNGANDVLFNLLKSSGNVNAKFSFKDIKINDKSAKNNISGIDLIQFGYNSDTPHDGKINQGFNFGYNGLKFKDSSISNRLIPEQFQTSLSLKNFPLMEVMNFTEEAIGNNKDQSAKQVAATKALNFLPQKLKEAGTILMLKNTRFGNSIYDVNIDGKIKAAPSSQLGGVGNLNIETTGLDAVMKALETMPNGASLAQQLTIFRMISEEKGDKNVAKIMLDKKGNISVNGKDVSALMGGGNSTPTP